MIRLHLSREVYDGVPLKPVPACGAAVDGLTLARGIGGGLVPPRAISAEYHCPACIQAIRSSTS